MTEPPISEERRSLPPRSARKTHSFFLTEDLASGSDNSGSPSDNEPDQRSDEAYFGHESQEISAKNLPAEIRDQPPCWLRSCTGRFDRYRSDLKHFGLWIRSCSAHLRTVIHDNASAACEVCHGEQKLHPEEPDGGMKRFESAAGHDFMLCSACHNDHKFQLNFFRCRELAPDEPPQKQLSARKRPPPPDSAEAPPAEPPRPAAQVKRRSRTAPVKIRVGPLATQQQLSVVGGSLVVRIRAAEPLEAIAPAKPFSARVSTFVEYLEVLQKMQEDGLVSEELQEQLLGSFAPAESSSLVEAALRHAIAHPQRQALATAVIDRARVQSTPTPNPSVNSVSSL